RVGFSKLLIATGAHPVVPGFPNLETYRPHVLRTMEDADRLREALACKPHARVLVSGTSMVGLKVVEACLDRKVDVTMLGRSPHILRSSAHPVVAERLE
ncbi:MAG: FAD-dependent oxidoreductase, partial [Eggerthellaceae bacterium]|nr:FAD-dependent oxidoreductase [Eggerthellaceae bacterium]